MKNHYYVDGAMAVLICEAPIKHGGGTLEVRISAEKLNIVKAWPGGWFGYTDYKGGLLIKGSKRITNVKGYSVQQPYLHRVITDAKPGEKVIFKDGNTLNCTNENLIIATRQPKKGVHWRQDKKKYEVAAYHEGRKYHLGLWDKDKLAEANNAVTEFRQLGPKEYFKKYPKKGG